MKWVIISKLEEYKGKVFEFFLFLGEEDYSIKVEYDGEVFSFAAATPEEVVKKVEDSFPYIWEAIGIPREMLPVILEAFYNGYLVGRAESSDSDSEV